MRYFLVIGAQKAGTSWLYEQLRRHPQVHLSAWKELHYFDIACPPSRSGNFARWYIRAAREANQKGKKQRVEKVLEVLNLPFADEDGAAYREYLTRDATGGTTIAGDITPAYATLGEDGFQMAYDILDAPRVVFVMRDPLQRLWSQIRMRGDDNPERHFEHAVLAPANWARCDYPGTITRLEAVFPPRLIHYAFYEDLFTPGALGRLATFLGIDEVWDWDLDERVREGPKISMPEPGAELLDQLMPVYEFVRRRFGDGVPANWLH